MIAFYQPDFYDTSTNDNATYTTSTATRGYDRFNRFYDVAIAAAALNPRPKNWRWFHVFRKPQEIVLPLLQRRAAALVRPILAMVNRLERARRKRRRWLTRLRAWSSS